MHQWPPRSGIAVPGPRADAITDGGYRWFYLDAITDDAEWSIVIIALLGNPFSPNYARAIRTNDAPNPLRFVALNVAIYSRKTKYWALTERRLMPAYLATDGLMIGHSSMRWVDEKLVVDIHEVEPWTRKKIRGRVTFIPEVLHPEPFALDSSGHHSWWPIAPLGHVSVDMQQPRITFEARGYHDANAGDEPIARGFEHWSWSRVITPKGSIVTYDASLRDGSPRALALEFDKNGSRLAEPTFQTSLPETAWRLPRSIRMIAPATHFKNLEDTPFYSRDLVTLPVAGRTFYAMHETLHTNRLRNRIVEWLLPFRMRSG